MPKRHPADWPAVWLVTDARNDTVLEQVLARLPRGSGLIFRHYHLPPGERRRRFMALRRLARRRGHAVALSGTARQALRWGADAAYGSPRTLAAGPAIARLVTAHGLREIALARRARANAIVLSPVYPTRSHRGRSSLGLVRFRLLAGRAGLPVVALGGMTWKRAKAMGSATWAAIDGLFPGSATRWIHKDS